MPRQPVREVQEKPPSYTSIDTDNSFWFTFGFRKFDVDGMREALRHLFEVRGGTVYDDDPQMLALKATQVEMEFTYLRGI